MGKIAEHIVEGRITSMAFGGDGIMRHEGQVIFVPFAAPDDEVSVKIIQQKKNFARGSIQKIINGSASRTEAPCVHFKNCGGCQLQHLHYEKQLEIKKSFVEDAFSRIAKISSTINDTKATEHRWQYRRHIRLHWHQGQLGFMSDALKIVAIKQCAIFSESTEIFKALIAIATRLNASLPIEISVYKTANSRFVVSFNAATKHAKQLFTDALRAYPLIQGIMWQQQHRYEELGDCSLSFELLGLSFRYNPKVFVQAHPEQSAALYEELCSLASRVQAKRVLDLYCGFGASSLLLRRAGFEVEALELNPESIRLAQENEQNNHLSGIQWHAADVDAVSDEIFNRSMPDTVVVNPPRTGLSTTLLQTLLRHQPKHILYISCMPTTLARDIALLKESYQVEHCQPYDMFPQTTHVETLVWLQRKSLYV